MNSAFPANTRQDQKQPQSLKRRPIKVLVIDIGGTHVKFRTTGQKTVRRFPSGPKLTPRRMVAGVKRLDADWNYAAVTIGYPGVIKDGRVVKEPYNLGPGWVGFNFKAAFGRPV